MTGTMVREMSNAPKQKTDPSQPMVCQMRIEGHLDDQWTDWFGGMTITLEENGDTLLTGPVIDQAALFGLLKKVRDLGMTLVSVNRVEHSRADAPEGKPGASATCKKRRRENERAKHDAWCSRAGGEIHFPRGRNHP
jgi:hypothetical protein